MTTETDSQRLARNESNVHTTGHRLDNPSSYLHAVEAAGLARTIRCPHCNVVTHLVPMGGDGWGVEEDHELHCPRHEDNKDEG
ncbi:hypothetical protein DJ010_20360 [Nocardioides silvaticus]|uniref:Uncharacterized protein n=1 Tax=Nocardioides silvaticus TaxID=2201891 RepID=A0A316T9R8_9ACTN|nr:hypothetical protein [Nocardioides silvaticus]PWN00977.1 hypothetical protein DJ010_20360 [Nocardioides silvaticus]